MRIKHSKFRNTGLIYELLVKQVASDTLANRDSKAISILKRYYSKGTPLANEYKLYEFVSKTRGASQTKAEAIVSTINEVSRKLNLKKIREANYNLIKEIKEVYNIDQFFSIKVRDYKAFAALYCLLEAQSSEELIDPEFLVENKTTLLEHLTNKEQSVEKTTETLIENYSKDDSNLRLLTYKFLLERFNKKYKDFLPEQKNVLKQFIISVSSNNKIRDFVNEEYDKIRKEVATLSNKIDDSIVKIKLDEVTRNIQPISKKDRITDSHLVSIMKYYELVSELRKFK